MNLEILSVGALAVALVVTAADLLGRRRVWRRLDPGAPGPRGPAGHRDRRGRAHRREVRSVEADLARLAEGTARELRIGASMSTALGSAAETVGGSTAAEITAVLRQADGAGSLARALTSWSRRWSSGPIDQFVAVIVLADGLGAGAASALDAAAGSLRDRAEVRDEVRALTSQSRASAVLLTGLPVVAAGGLAVVEPATSAFLFGTGGGLACVGAAIVLSVAGWWWMGWLMAVDR